MGGSHEWPEWRSRVTVAQYGNLRAPISFFGTVATNVMGPKYAMSPTWSLYKIIPLYSTHYKVSESIVRMEKFQSKLPKNANLCKIWHISAQNFSFISFKNQTKIRSDSPQCDIGIIKAFTKICHL